MQFNIFNVYSIVLYIIIDLIFVNYKLYNIIYYKLRK